MRLTDYTVKSERAPRDFTVALVADLHDREGGDVLKALSEMKPDIIAIPGDLTARLDCLEGEAAPCDRGIATHKNAFGFLSEAAKLAPTFYSLGNHELCGHYYKENRHRKCRKENLDAIYASGARLLDDRFCDFEGLRIGGLTSGLTNPDDRPRLGWLDGFCAGEGFKILLCHHPEYYPLYLRDYPIDLILSGHAHGGQVRLFGRGLYAPGQGILPKYTSGIHDGRFVISRGLTNTAKPIPRLFNPPELVRIGIISAK